MPIPVVAIVGRPNVGKSSVFNMLVGERTSIVEPTAGVTRDRVSAICSGNDKYFELVDTGGHGIVDRDDLEEHVERQIGFAIEQASMILFVVDAREGISPLDQQTAELVRRRAKVPVRLVANKVDAFTIEAEVGQFHRLGFGVPIPTSAISNDGRTALTEAILEVIGPLGDETPAEPVMKIALVGKRNAGKSSFINALAGEERVIVSEIAGTTRDSIDVRFEKDGRVFVAIDTAGVRKKSKIEDSIEFFAMDRAERSIRRADVVLMLIDATEPVGQVEKKLISTIAEEFKPCVLVVNKWDLAKGRASTEEFGEYLTKLIPHLDYAPIAFTSANVGKNIGSTIEVAEMLFKQARTRVTTGQLNAIIHEAVQQNPPKMKRGTRTPRVYYATQVSEQPPTIVLFVNDPKSITPGFERFLLNRFRERLPFEEVPIRLMYRARRREAAGKE